MFGTLTIGFFVKNTYIPGLITFISLNIFNLILASIYKMHDLLFYISKELLQIQREQFESSF